MYIPDHFAEDRREELTRIIQTHPLGVLVTLEEGELDAHHIPFEYDPGAGEHGVLTAHVARANPVWRRCPTGTRVLVVFRGAQAYVSPNWYPSKHETHRQVPTWNYEVVHARGVVTVHEDERFLRGVLARLTRRHESLNTTASHPQPWKMGDAPPDYVAGMLREIVGIEIAVTALEGKRKLSQNKDARDRLGPAAALAELGSTELAQAMRAGVVRQAQE